MATREEIQNMNFGVAAEMGPYGQQQGALRDILKITSGSSANADRAIALANQLMPMPEEADPYEAMFRYFSGMAKAASQPGATVLSSALAPMDVPLDYYTAKKKQSKESEQARMQAALSLGPSLKAPKATYSDPKFYMVSEPDGKGGFTTPVETPLTAKQYAELPTDGSVRVTAVPKAGTKYTKRTLYKSDGSKIDVYSDTQEKAAIDDGWGYQQAAGTGTKYTKRTLYKSDGSKIDVYSDTQEQAAISAGYGRVKKDDFDNVTVYLEDGSSRVAQSQIELDTLTGEGGGGWSRTKPAAGSTAQFKRTVYKDGQELTVYSEEDYNAAISDNNGWSPEKPAPAGPQGSAPERATNRVLDFVDAFTVNGGMSDPRSFAQFLSDVRLMAKPQIISFKDPEGNMQSASTPGVDAYKFISESYGPEVADAIKALSKGQPTVVAVDDTGGDTEDDTGDGGVKKVIVAGKEFTVFSSTPASMPKEASDAIVDAAGALRDINIAYDLLFPNGKLNRAAIVAANFLPDGGLNRTKVDTDSRTAYQSMRRVIELILRARTGAAAPEAEVQNYLKLYFPSSLDNDQQARNKFITLAQYFTDTTRILSQGRLLYDPSIPEADRKFDVTKHGIPLGDAASSAANEAPDVVTVTSEWTLEGVKYKQLSDGRIITEEAE